MMKSKRPIHRICRAVMVPAVLFLGLAISLAGSLPAAAQTPVDLVTAVQEQKLEVSSMTGRGGAYAQGLVRLQARNLTDGALSLEPALGQLLISDNSQFCNVVVLGAQTPIYFASGPSAEPVTFNLYAYCLEPASSATPHKFPTLNAGYSFGPGLASDSMRAVLQRIKDENGQSGYAAQLAVWLTARGSSSLAELQDELGANDLTVYQELVNKYLGQNVDVATMPGVPTATPTMARATGTPTSTMPPGITPMPGGNTGSRGTGWSPDWAQVLLGGGCLVVTAATVWVLLSTARRSRGAARPRPLNPGTTEPPPIENTPAPVSNSTSMSEQSRPPIQWVEEESATSSTRRTVDTSAPRQHGGTRPGSARVSAVRQALPSTPKTTPSPPVVAPPSTGSDAPPRVEPTAPLLDPVGVARPILPTEPVHGGELTLCVLENDVVQPGKEVRVPLQRGTLLSRVALALIIVEHDTTISSPHAVFGVSNGRLYVMDLGSRNGVRHNGQLITATSRPILKDGDTLQFGNSVFVLREGTRRELQQQSDPHQVWPLGPGDSRWVVTHRDLDVCSLSEALGTEDPHISVPHALIEAQDRLTVRDLNSSTGTKVNGRPISRLARQQNLQNGVRLELGQAVFLVKTNIELQAPRLIRGSKHEYHLVRLIAPGGMADVFLYCDSQDDSRQYAVKIPHLTALQEGNEEGRRLHERFKREAEHMLALDHPHIVPAVESGVLAQVGDCADVPYLVLQYIPGADLLRLLEIKKALRPTDACGIVGQVADALEHLHIDKSLVHCDVKLNNVMLDLQGCACLFDMGIAVSVGARPMGLGVEDYMPPEVAKGMKDGTYQAAPTYDVYSLGVVLFKLLTGEYVDVKAVHTKSAPLSDESKVDWESCMRKHGVPDRLQVIVMRCVNPIPTLRYQQMSRLIRDLQEWSEKSRLDSLMESVAKEDR